MHPIHLDKKMMIFFRVTSKNTGEFYSPFGFSFQAHRVFCSPLHAFSRNFYLSPSSQQGVVLANSSSFSALSSTSSKHTCWSTNVYIYSHHHGRLHMNIGYLHFENSFPLRRHHRGSSPAMRRNHVWWWVAYHVSTLMSSLWGLMCAPTAMVIRIPMHILVSYDFTILPRPIDMYHEFMMVS
jgi:hypothetical protein